MQRLRDSRDQGNRRSKRKTGEAGKQLQEGDSTTGGIHRGECIRQPTGGPRPAGRGDATRPRHGRIPARTPKRRNVSRGRSTSEESCRAGNSVSETKPEAAGAGTRSNGSGGKRIPNSRRKKEDKSYARKLRAKTRRSKTRHSRGLERCRRRGSEESSKRPAEQAAAEQKAAKRIQWEKEQQQLQQQQQQQQEGREPN